MKDIGKQSQTARALHEGEGDGTVVRFLRSLWRNDDATHLLAIKTPSRNGLIHEPVTLADAAERVAHHVARGADVYFACAGYDTPNNRTQANAGGTFSFWIDIDVGPEKALQKKGYATVDEALAAMREAMHNAGLPQPSVLVSSGGGVHAYFVLDDWVAKNEWQDSARKLKAILAKVGFLADPARTADVASIMRVPDTLNHKYSPPKEVGLIGTIEPPIPTQMFVDAVQAAHTRLCPTPVIQPKSSPAGTSSRTADGATRIPIDLDALRSALQVLTPDCDETTWKFHRIVPLTHLAKQHPDHADAIHQLAIDWSSGALAGIRCQAWDTPGKTNGQTGAQEFPKVWHRFMAHQNTARPVTIATIFKDARDAGWTPPMFEAAEARTVVVSPPPMGARSKALTTEPAACVPAYGIPSDASSNAATPELEAALQKVQDVIDKTANDVGAPFEPEALQTLAVIQRENLAEYQRVLARLKGSGQNLSIAQLERAMKNARQLDGSPSTHHGYAEHILARLAVNGHAPVAHEGSLYVLNAKTHLWESMPSGQLEKQVATAFDNSPHCAKRSDYASIAAHAMALAEDAEFFAGAATGIATPNGFYRVVNGQTQIEPLTPEHRQRVMLDFAPKAGPMPLFDAFLHDTFTSSNPGEEGQQIARVQEIAGAVMLGIAARLQKAQLLYDPFGRAGKGTFVDIIRGLVPKPFIVAVSPFNWAREYYVASLAGARLNIVGELPDGDALPSAAFKTVLGGDLITGRHPTHRPITFKNEAAHIFLSNHMITTRDQSEAFFARWEIIEFPNSRLKTGQPLDPHLAERIIAAELPAIATWALEGASRLLANGRYTPSSAHDRLMQKWRRSNSSMDEFIHEACALDANASVKRSDFYRHYRSWCADNGRQPYAKARVKELLAHNIGLGITLGNVNGYEVFHGVKVN